MNLSKGIFIVLCAVSLASLSQVYAFERGGEDFNRNSEQFHRQDSNRQDLNRQEFNRDLNRGDFNRGGQVNINGAGNQNQQPSYVMPYQEPGEPMPALPQ